MLDIRKLKWDLFVKSSAVNQRIGQYFVNQYVAGAWPELYYANDIKAMQLITDWMYDHCYSTISEIRGQK